MYRLQKSFRINHLGRFLRIKHFAGQRYQGLMPFILLFFLGFASAPALAQVHKPTEKLDSLYTVRLEVYNMAKEIYEQNNAFFGGKAKKDLMDAIEELKKVVAIDNKIVLEIERMRLANEFERFSTEEEMLKSTSRLEELEKANQRIQAGQDEKEKQIQELKDQLEEGKQSRIMQGFLVFVLFISNGVLVYFLMKRKRNQPGKIED